MAPVTVVVADFEYWGYLVYIIFFKYIIFLLLLHAYVTTVPHYCELTHVSCNNGLI